MMDTLTLKTAVYLVAKRSPNSVFEDVSQACRTARYLDLFVVIRQLLRE